MAVRPRAFARLVTLLVGLVVAGLVPWTPSAAARFAAGGDTSGPAKLRTSGSVRPLEPGREVELQTHVGTNLAPGGTMSLAVEGFAAPRDILPASNGNDGNLETRVGRSAYATWGDTGWCTWYWIIDLGARFRVTEVQWWDTDTFYPNGLWGSNDGSSWSSIAGTWSRISPADTWWHIGLTGTRPRMVFDAPETYRYYRVGHSEYHNAGAFYIGEEVFGEWAVLGDPNPLPDFPVEPAPGGTVLRENGATAGDPVDTFSGAFT